MKGPLLDSYSPRCVGPFHTSFNPEASDAAIHGARLECILQFVVRFIRHSTRKRRTELLSTVRDSNVSCDASSEGRYLRLLHKNFLGMKQFLTNMCVTNTITYVIQLCASTATHLPRRRNAPGTGPRAVPTPTPDTAPPPTRSPAESAPGTARRTCRRARGRPPRARGSPPRRRPPPAAPSEPPACVTPGPPARGRRRRRHPCPRRGGPVRRRRCPGCARGPGRARRVSRTPRSAGSAAR